MVIQCFLKSSTPHNPVDAIMVSISQNRCQHSVSTYSSYFILLIFNHMFILPDLDYDYSALEPHLDALTMQIHHSKHHQTYVDKLNAALKDVQVA
jgi:hypothetical protein